MLSRFHLHPKNDPASEFLALSNLCKAATSKESRLESIMEKLFAR